MHPTSLPDEQPSPRLLKAEDIAAQLGCAASTVYRWMRAGVLPSVKIGGLVRVRESSWKTFLESMERGDGQSD